MTKIVIRDGGYAMKKNRVRELRKSRGMNQETLAAFVGVSQQTISKIEKDVTCIGTDLLIQLANYFNVTTDYILGLSNEKRNLFRENRMSTRLENYYNLVIEYEELSEYNKKVLLEIMDALREVQKREAAEHK